MDKGDCICLLSTMKNKCKYNVILWPILVFLFWHGTLNAQKDASKEKFYQSLNLSYIVGGQVYNDNSDISIGLGTGYLSLSNENFLNHFVEIIGKKKKKNNTPFVNFQGGYSIGWLNSTNSSQYYKINGGIFINAGLGRMIKINEKYILLFHWSYCHQFAKMEYEIFGGNDYSEILNYDMLQISIGVLFDWK